MHGKRVLDAGCGPGAYAEWLVKHGAQVVALDANSKMVEFVRERLGNKAEVLLASLEQSLDFLDDSTFDIVLGPLVMDYVEDWHAVCGEFYRVLCDDGCLVFSMEHPYSKFRTHANEAHYFEVELVEYEWTGFGMPVRVSSYQRPMSAVIEPLVATGFAPDRLLEPIPTEAFKEKLPEDYEDLRQRPGFMCVRAVKTRSNSHSLSRNL